MGLKDRIGIDVGAGLSISEAVSWAAENGVHYVDIRLEETSVNGISEEETRIIRETCVEDDIHLGLHPLSAVNMAATEPFVREAVDEYMSTYFRVADRLEWSGSSCTVATISLTTVQNGSIQASHVSNE